ncbi:holin family protein [Roseicitreum antarcticum]|uniref:Holin of 3TMs, for gene-transfer release n=1 Tax=Roseicitreum antarcticum TaxID=564137 RepID=A0A1H2ZVS9_9RHOB|nr:holin family protein [Roseicitreum antarcticum]SDX21650.1 Holin of 3TMs, for gene-transfer release [Roseicitreum antarcticum]
MGLMRSLFGLIFGTAGNASALGDGVRGVAEVFRPNATRAMELGHDAYMAAHATHGAEFQHARTGWFDGFVNGLNRLPRPLLALGTLALFVYAMRDPSGFAVRMEGLATVPEPLWWLLGAVVAFYFGARESHHLRSGWQVARPAAPAAAAAGATQGQGDAAVSPGVGRTTPGYVPDAGPESGRDPAQANPALRDWMARAS